ncbi:hypothetical protein H7J77_06525 [Mycolicibacillus parakoreensis]|uniref:Transmembrane protein n=1 Tax=Mycolicibacillus parakoreensis TaxID=1069221 RepID=A0ABY3U670_9MYCO|nr:gephyrin-like molybdotransferase receptor GlpR [Mycolicibacillus parakoreensis]MCV7315192.1 hypothetical protein [Mycolicibacillus parakoreensis]ULN53470.1 hypothetical protein MIU77_03760 [Mycolicibacillus parakoreensis]
MPSIPQSLLWISLVVLWLFVLVPMLISKRDAVRRTSDVALATRVLTSGASARLLKRAGPASGHRSDPHWQPAGEGLDDDPLDADRDAAAPRTSVAVATPAAPEPDYLDVDVVEEVTDGAAEADTDQLAAPPRDEQAREAAEAVNAGRETAAEAAEGVSADGAAEEAAADVFETEEVDEDGIDEEDAYDAETAEAAEAAEAAGFSGIGATGPSARAAARRYQRDARTAAAVSARKYRFRKRAIGVMATLLLISAVAALTVAPGAWWLCVATGAVTVLYLTYLRRQTRIEEQLRRRRAQRMARARLGVENTADRDYDIVPSRLRRPGAAVLEIDDEDPIFEHLEYTEFAREHDWAPDLPRAAGQ